MAKEGRPVLDPSIRDSISRRIRQLMDQRGFHYTTLIKALRQKGVTVSEHTIRAWGREGKQSATIPSLPHLIALSRVFGVSLDELIGMQEPKPSPGLWEINRRPRSEDEKKIIDLLRHITRETSHPNIDQRVISDLADYRKHLLNELIFSDLIHVNAENIPRDKVKEEKIKEKNRYLKDVRVFELPGGETFSEVRHFFFSEASAHYLEEIVASGANRIGIASGRTTARMMRRTKRGKLRNVVLFPILLTDSNPFSNMTTTSTTIVSEAVYRHEDFGARLPDNMNDPQFHRVFLLTADALFFSLGNTKHSLLLRILTNRGFPKENLTPFAGDLLFNLLTKEGRTIDEIDNMEKSPQIKEVKKRLKEPDMKTLPLDLELVSEHAERRLNTVTIAYGSEKQDITRAALARKKPVCNVLITDVTLAEGLLEN